MREAWPVGVAPPGPHEKTARQASQCRMSGMASPACCLCCSRAFFRLRVGRLGFLPAVASTVDMSSILRVANELPPHYSPMPP